MSKVIKVDSKILDDIVKLEAEALRRGLNDPAVRDNPIFLAKVRQFLKDNEYYTGMEVEGAKEIVRKAKELPTLFKEMEEAQ